MSDLNKFRHFGTCLNKECNRRDDLNDDLECEQCVQAEEYRKIDAQQSEILSRQVEERKGGLALN